MSNNHKKRKKIATQLLSELASYDPNKKFRKQVFQSTLPDINRNQIPLKFLVRANEEGGKGAQNILYGPARTYIQFQQPLITSVIQKGNWLPKQNLQSRLLQGVEETEEDNDFDEFISLLYQTPGEDDSVDFGEADETLNIDDEYQPDLDMNDYYQAFGGEDNIALLNQIYDILDANENTKEIEIEDNNSEKKTIKLPKSTKMTVTRGKNSNRVKKIDLADETGKLALEIVNKMKKEGKLRRSGARRSLDIASQARRNQMLVMLDGDKELSAKNRTTLKMIVHQAKADADMRGKPADLEWIESMRRDYRSGHLPHMHYNLDVLGPGPKRIYHYLLARAGYRYDTEKEEVVKIKPKEKEKEKEK